MARPGSGDGSRELRPKRRDSPIIVGRFTSCSSWPSLRLHPSGAGDDRDGCWRLLMVLDCSSTVGWGTTLHAQHGLQFFYSLFFGHNISPATYTMLSCLFLRISKSARTYLLPIQQQAKKRTRAT